MKLRVGRFQAIFEDANQIENEGDSAVEFRWIVLWGLLIFLFAFFGITTDENGFKCVDENTPALIRSLLR